MAWTLEFDNSARRELRKRPPDIGERIIMALEQIAATDDSRKRGHALTGAYAGHWRYRAGDYRAIVRIEDQKLLIVVIVIGHRREIYR